MERSMASGRDQRSRSRSPITRSVEDNETDRSRVDNEKGGNEAGVLQDPHKEGQGSHEATVPKQPDTGIGDARSELTGECAVMPEMSARGDWPAVDMHVPNKNDPDGHSGDTLPGGVIVQPSAIEVRFAKFDVGEVPDAGSIGDLRSMPAEEPKDSANILQAGNWYQETNRSGAGQELRLGGQQIGDATTGAGMLSSGRSPPAATAGISHLVELSDTAGTSMATVKPDNTDTDLMECSICCDGYRDEDTENCKISLDCGHAFHAKCLEGWMKVKQTCPLCRGRSDQRLPRQEQNFFVHNDSPGSSSVSTAEFIYFLNANISSDSDSTFNAIHHSDLSSHNDDDDDNDDE